MNFAEGASGSCTTLKLLQVLSAVCPRCCGANVNVDAGHENVLNDFRQCSTGVAQLVRPEGVDVSSFVDLSGDDLGAVDIDGDDSGGVDLDGVDRVGLGGVGFDGVDLGGVGLGERVDGQLVERVSEGARLVFETTARVVDVAAEVSWPPG